MEPVICYQCPKCGEQYTPEDMDVVMPTPSMQDVATYKSCDECGFEALLAWAKPAWEQMVLKHIAWRQQAAKNRAAVMLQMDHANRSEIGRIVANWRDGELTAIETVADVQGLWKSAPDTEGTR